MRSRALAMFLVAGLSVVANGLTVAAGEGEAEPPRVVPHEPLAVGPSRPLPAARYRHVEELIARLATIDGECGGIRAGFFFAPTDPEGEAPPGTGRAAFRELVALGPEAIPALLGHLDDETPIALDELVSRGWEGILFRTSMGVNPVDEAELAAVRAAFPGGLKDDPTHPDDDAWSPFSKDPQGRWHSVTIGDCCFAILGQVTNRRYEVVRSCPDGIHVVSPTRDPRVAKAVRSQWAGRDPRLELARRLLDDFFTTGVPESWDWTGSPQAGAAGRLAFYFPDASESLIERAIDTIHADDPDVTPLSAAYPDELAWGLRSSDRPAIRAALLRLALRMGSVCILDYALPSVDGRPSLCHDIFALLRRQKTPGLHADRIARVLSKVAKQWPDRVAAFLPELLRGSPGQSQAAVTTVFDTGMTLPIEAWMPCLVRTYDVRGRTRVEFGEVETARMCDLAAFEIARQRDDLDFDPRADEATRDARIAHMLKVLTPEYWK